MEGRILPMILETINNYIPILVAITSAMFVFFLNKINEKNKKLTIMAEESLDIYISKMYKEALEISQVYNYKVKNIKKFIIYYATRDDLYKLFDGEINVRIIELSIEIKTGKISNENLKKEFYDLSVAIEELYWDRLKFSASELKWTITKKVNSKWYSVPLDLLFGLKSFFEYLSIIFLIMSVFTIAIIITNIFESTPTLPIYNDLRILILTLTLLIVLIYMGIMALYSLFSNKEQFIKRKLIGK